MNSRDKYEKLIKGPIKRFDQRNDMFRRARYDPEWMERATEFYGPMRVKDKPGYALEFQALQNGAWYLERNFGMGVYGSNHGGLLSWKTTERERGLLRDDLKIDTPDPAITTKKIKAAARHYGASLVGVCDLDRRWVYSHVSDDLTRGHAPMEIPGEYRYAIAMAIEMDYNLVKTSPTAGAAAATGIGYSKMSFVAGLLAQFIRGLGFKAIPCGNDTALSIPIAIEAGLGELGRNGLLITEEFGPRVRVCKVFTDLPLVPDEPRFFGVEAFCRKCMRCADDCPSRAISFDDRTTEAPTEANNPGVLKWPINPMRCFKYWIANNTDCANCIRVCPFNKERGLLHDFVRGCIKTAPWLNSFFIWMDHVLGYDEQLSPETVWEEPE